MTGGTLIATCTTGGDGVATAPTSTANAMVGANYPVTATIAGVTAPLSFALTNTAAAITITPVGGDGSVKVGGTLHLTATDSAHHDVTSLVQWQSLDPARATVDASGMVTGESPGPVTVTATLNGVTARILVTVLGPIPVGITVPPVPPSRPGGPVTTTTPPLPAPPGR